MPFLQGPIKFLTAHLKDFTFVSVLVTDCQMSSFFVFTFESTRSLQTKKVSMALFSFVIQNIFLRKLLFYLEGGVKNQLTSVI